MLINDVNKTIWCDTCKEWKTLYEVWEPDGYYGRVCDLKHMHELGYTWDSAYRLIKPEWSIDDIF